MNGLHLRLPGNGEELLSRAFPGGPSTQDRTLIQSLSAEGAENVLRRLSAVLESEKPDAPTGTELAALAGISIRLFYDLKRRWKRERSLAVLVPFQQPKRLSPLNQGAGHEIARVAGELAAATPDYVAAGVIAREVARRIEGPNAFRSALRHVRMARLRLSKDIAYLGSNYAQNITCDVSSISIPAFGNPQMAVPGVAFVMERASRLVLSAVVVSSAGVLAAQRKAAVSAIEFLSEQRVDRLAGVGQHIETEFVLGDCPQDTLECIRGRLFGTPGLDLIDNGSRRFGQRLVSLLGSRVGKIAFAPRFTAERAKLTGALEPSGLANHAQALIGLEFERHNEPILAVLEEVRFKNLELIADGAMAARLKLIADTLGVCCC